MSEVPGASSERGALVFSAHREFIHYTTSVTTYQAPLRGGGGK